MPIVIGKLPQKIFESQAGDYHVYKLKIHGGDQSQAIFKGFHPPKPMKTIEYIIFGEWVKHEKYGKQFVIRKTERSKIPNQEQQQESKMIVQALKASKGTRV